MKSLLKKARLITRTTPSLNNPISRPFHVLTPSYQAKPSPDFFKRQNDRWQRFQEEQPHTESFARFVLEKGAYAVLLYVIGSSVQMYLEAKSVAEEAEQVLQNASTKDTLEQLHTLRIQPNLYLMTNVTEQDRQAYYTTVHQLDELEQQLTQLLAKVQQHKDSLPNNQHLPLLVRFNILEEQLNKQLMQLAIAKDLNKSLWLHKNRQYSSALTIIDHLINRLENVSKTHFIATFLSREQLLAAAYNTKAKLLACQAIINITPQPAMLRKAALNSYKQAIVYLEQARKTEPENPMLTIELADLLNGKAFLLNAMGRPKAALALHQQALALKPNQVHTLSGLGLALYSIELKKPANQRNLANLDLAYGYFTRVTQLDEYNNVYVYRGQLRVLLDDIQGAMSDFDQAIKLSPYHYEAHFEKALLLVKQGKIHAAQFHFQTSMASVSDKPGLLAQLKNKAKQHNLPWQGTFFTQAVAMTSNADNFAQDMIMLSYAMTPANL